MSSPLDTQPLTRGLDQERAGDTTGHSAQLSRLRTLHDVSSALHATDDLPSLVRIIDAAGERATGGARGLLYLVDPETQLMAPIRRDEGRVETQHFIDRLIESRVVDWVIEQGTLEEVANWSSDGGRLLLVPLRVGRRGVGVWIFVCGEGELPAHYADQAPNAFFLELLGQQAAAAIDRVVANQHMAKKIRQLEGLHEAASLLARIVDPEEVAIEALRIIGREIPCALSLVYALEATPTVLRLVGAALEGTPAGDLSPFCQHLPLDASISGWVGATGQPLLVEDVATDPRFTQFAERPDWRPRNALAVPLRGRKGVLGVLTLVDRTGGFMMSELRMAMTYAVQVGKTLEGCHLHNRIRLAYNETVMALAAAVELKDPYTRGHVERVAEYAAWVARALDKDDAWVEQMRYAAALHDVGKIGISDAILGKQSSLTPEEYETVKTHTTIGADIVEQISFLRGFAGAIRHHHERWDGSGYPAGLAGEDIPLEARIVTVVDAFDAMTTRRPYSRPMTVEAALARLRELKESMFDPTIVDVFCHLIEERGPLGEPPGAPSSA